MENRVKLNAHNYNGWSTTHMWILKEADAWDPILVAPEEMLKEDKATIQKNTTAMKILFTGMDEYHQILCARKTSAKQVWSFLKERYDKLSTDKLLDLQNDLAACQYEGEGQKYIDEITRLYDEIAMFNDVIETNSSSIKCKLLNSCNMPNVVTAIKAVGLENKTGMNMNIIGASLVDLRFIYNTSVDVISYGPNLIYMGYVLGSLVGWLYKWINRQLTISIALMFVGLLVVLAPHCGTIAVFFAILIFNGIGVGIWDSSSSIWLVEMWPNGNSPLLQTSQAMYGLGAILAPLLASPFLHGEVNSTDTNDSNLTAMMTTTVGPLDIDLVTPHDRIVSLTLPFLIIGIVQFSAPALMFILFFTNRYKKIDPNNNDNDIFPEKSERSSSISSESFYKPKSKILDVRDIKYRFLKLTLVILSVSFCQAVEGNYFFFSSSMFQYLNIKMSASEAAKVLSILSTSFCVSRVMAAIVSIKVKPDIFVFYHYFIILTATAILVIGQNSRLWIYAGTVAMGTGFSAIFSGIMAFTERHLRLTNQICSIFAFSAGLLAMVTPFVLSNLVDFHAHPIILLFLTGGFITASLITFIGASVLIWAI